MTNTKPRATFDKFGVEYGFSVRYGALFPLYQTSHFLFGFMGESAGQEKSLANSGMLEKGPRTLLEYI